MLGKACGIGNGKAYEMSNKTFRDREIVNAIKSGGLEFLGNRGPVRSQQADELLRA